MSKDKSIRASRAIRSKEKVEKRMMSVFFSTPLQNDTERVFVSIRVDEFGPTDDCLIPLFGEIDKLFGCSGKAVPASYVSRVAPKSVPSVAPCQVSSPRRHAVTARQSSPARGYNHKKRRK